VPLREIFEICTPVDLQARYQNAILSLSICKFQSMGSQFFNRDFLHNKFNFFVNNKAILPNVVNMLAIY